MVTSVHAHEMIEAYVLVKEKGGEEQMCFFRKDKWDFTADKKIGAVVFTGQERFCFLLQAPGGLR